MALDPDKRVRRTFDQVSFPAYGPSNVEAHSRRDTSQLCQVSASPTRIRDRACGAAAPFENSGAVAPVNSVPASHVTHSIRHFSQRPNSGHHSTKLSWGEFFGSATSANLEKWAAHFTTHYFSSRADRPDLSHFYSTIECRVSPLLLDTPRRVEMVVTHSEHRKSAHSTRHLFKGYPKHRFCAFSTFPQALTAAEKS